jgi:uncharacterized protein (TIGR02186 family)
MRRVLSAAIAAAVLLWAAPAGAQRLVASTSDPEVSIDSTFAGEKITLFGAIEPKRDETEIPAGTYDIVIAISGPAADRVARLKEQMLGVWLNREQVLFKGFPTFFWVISSAPLDQIAAAETLAAQMLTFDAQTRRAAGDGEPMAEEFGAELIRLMRSRGLFGVEERGVQFLSDRFYTARIDLPAFVPNGNFLARTLLFRDGEVVAARSDGFTVRTAGIERFVADAARDQSFVYGLVCVLLALGTGWLGGVAFRR